MIVRWPGQPEQTVGIEDHTAESIAFWMTFPEQKLDNRPYKVFLGDGDWTASIARFRGTMAGPMQGPDGSEIPPTGKSFEVNFYTVAKWHDGQIVEENLMYDLVTFLKQIGLKRVTRGAATLRSALLLTGAGMTRAAARDAAALRS